MRISNEDREVIKGAIDAVLAREENANLLAEYTRHGWGHERFAWDVLWEAVRLDLIDLNLLYDKGLNDGHIGRVLSRVTQDPQGYRARVAAGTRRKDLRNE